MVLPNEQILHLNRIDLLNSPKKRSRLDQSEMSKEDNDKCIFVIRQLESILDADKRERELREKRNQQQIELNKMKLKDVMKTKIKQTKEMLKELNGKELDVTTRLALLQNQQLITELEYQSRQAEKLITKNINLEKEITELRRELEIHKQVETELAKQAKIYQNQLVNYISRTKELQNNTKSVKKEKEQLTNEKMKPKEGNDELILFLEDKLEEAEKKYSSFQADYEILHTNYLKQQKIIDKMKDKYGKASLLLVEFLDNILNATPNFLQDEKNLYLDVERL